MERELDDVKQRLTRVEQKAAEIDSSLWVMLACAATVGILLWVTPSHATVIVRDNVFTAADHFSENNGGVRVLDP